MPRALLAVTAAAILLTAACHHAPYNPQTDPVALASIRADLRLVGRETTWVARGSGYELIGRTKSDLIALQPQLDREVAVLHRVFPHDSLATLALDVRRTTPPDKPYVSAAPVPGELHLTVVELVLPSLGAKPADDKNARGSRTPFVGDPTAPAIRAWLSAHATALTHTPTRSVQMKGEVDDSRVSGWVPEMVASLTTDSLVDFYTSELGSHANTLIPLITYFTMERPAPSLAEGRGETGRTTGRGGQGGTAGGGMGGMGGRGMGGRGGRGGMSRGGGGTRGVPGGANGEAATFNLEGRALFTAQSSVLARYLTRDGADILGALADAQILGQPIDGILVKHGLQPVAQMDSDWRSWLIERAALVRR